MAMPDLFRYLSSIKKFLDGKKLRVCYSNKKKNVLLIEWKLYGFFIYINEKIKK